MCNPLSFAPCNHGATNPSSLSNLPPLPTLSTIFNQNTTLTQISPQNNRNISGLSISPTNTTSAGPSQISPHRPVVQDKPYVCDYCGRGYSYLASLQQHLKTHQIEYQFQCTGCSRLHKTKAELEEHKKTHESEGSDNRPHQCETCGKRFTLLENLHRHQMIHSDQRPFHCAFCGKRFRLAQHLKEHIRIHTGEKPYKCEICGRAFCQISNLKSHMKTHSKVKAFGCDICGKTFRRSFTLKQHKLIHERDGKKAESTAKSQIPIKEERTTSVESELDVETITKEVVVKQEVKGNSSDNDINGLKRKNNSSDLEFSSDSGYSKRQKTTSTENESDTTDALKLVQRIQAAVTKRRPSSSSCKSHDESDDIDIIGDENEEAARESTGSKLPLQGPNNSAATATAAAHAAIAAAIATKQQQVQQQQQAIAAILARSRNIQQSNIPFSGNNVMMNQLQPNQAVSYGLQGQMIQNFLAQQQHR